MKNRAGITVAGAVALVMLSVLPFAQALRSGLVWDDPMLLSEVSRVAGPGGVGALFNSDFRLASDRPLGYYRPATTTSLWWQIEDASRTGKADALDGTARSLHAVNLLIHAVCTLLVWRVLRRLGGRGWTAWLVTALFAVHPVHVEPVVFISARTDLLAAMFVLGSLLCWLEARSATGWRRTAALTTGALLALAGMLAKEQALLLPVVLVAWSLLLAQPHRRGWWNHNRAWLVAWLAAAAIALVMRAQAGVGFGPAQGLAASGGVQWFVRLGLPALVLYLRTWFIPAPLSPYYTSHDLAWSWPGAVALVATLVLVVMAARNRRGREAIAAGCFTLIFLLPVLHLAPLGGAVAAERFFYLPSVGLALIVSLAASVLEARPALRVTSRGVLGAAVVAGVVMTVQAVRPWKSDATLFAHMVEVSPDAATAHRGLGEVMYRAGKYSESARELREAVRLDPDYSDAYELLGVVSAQQGDYATAKSAFESVARLNPGRVSAYINLGVLALDEGDLDAALASFRHAVELDPSNPDVHFRLGTMWVMIGDIEGANREAAILDRLDARQARGLRQLIQSATTNNPAGP